MKPKTIKVVNPSGYIRSDYVEVELKPDGKAKHSASDENSVIVAEKAGGILSLENPLVVPMELDEKKLRLIRVWDRRQEEEIPYQIDRVFGHDSQKRIMTFLSDNTPPGDPDYKETGTCAVFRLEEKPPKDFSVGAAPSPLKVDHYYERPKEAEPKDGFSQVWDEERRAHTVKLHNGRIEVAFRLLPLLGVPKTSDLAGSVTSVLLRDAPGRTSEKPDNMLCPFSESLEKRWGQLTKLVFFPLPWELQWCERRLKSVAGGGPIVWHPLG